MVQKNIERYGGTLPIFLLWYLVVIAGMSTLPQFRQKIRDFCVVLDVILVILAVRIPV